MTVKHHVDEINKLIITDWKGNADIDKFTQAYKRYMETIRNNPENDEYDEIVNLTGIKKLNITLQGLKEFARFSTLNDRKKAAKMALIVNAGTVYMLAKAYVVIRKLMPGSRKKVRVFLNHFDALGWINSDK